MSRELPWEGGCRCGRVRIRIAAAPLLSMACHCKGCQRMTGGPYSLSVAIPAEGFAVTQGETVVGGLHGAAQHHHCGWCLSWMFTRPDGALPFVNVRTPMLDAPDELAPFIETQTAEKLPWVTTPARRSYERFPPMDAYEALIAEYRAQA